MVQDKEQPMQPLTPPPDTDPHWREKIETANQARKFGQEIRMGKDSSFRRAVGGA
jgi:hypothetical protein